MLKGREENFSLVFCFPGNGDSGPLKQARCGNSHQHDMTEDETFEKVDFHEMELDDEYYDCVFIACDFSKLVIRNTDFEKCEFRACNFTLASFKEAFRDVTFADCKMTGADFTDIDRFSDGLVFENSHLDYASFVEARLRKTVFRGCKMYEGYFNDADMAESVFDRCDLERASFVGANLEKADFSTSFNFSINPAMCKLKKAVFSRHGLEGLLAHLDIDIRG